MRFLLKIRIFTTTFSYKISWILSIILVMLRFRCLLCSLLNRFLSRSLSILWLHFFLSRFGIVVIVWLEFACRFNWSQFLLIDIMRSEQWIGINWWHVPFIFIFARQYLFESTKLPISSLDYNTPTQISTIFFIIRIFSTTLSLCVHF